MPEPASAPSRGTIPHLGAESFRKLRCLRLVENTNGIKLKATEQCQNERLPGSDLCARHLGDAAADFRAIIGSVREAGT